jgi:hypothetical protein
MTYHRVCNKSNTTGTTCGEGTAYHSGVQWITATFIWWFPLGIPTSLVDVTAVCRLKLRRWRKSNIHYAVVAKPRGVKHHDPNPNRAYINSQRLTDTLLCDNGCSWLAKGQCFSPGTPFFSTNKTDRHNVNIKIFSKVNNTKQLPYQKTINRNYIISIDHIRISSYLGWLNKWRCKFRSWLWTNTEIQRG